MNEKWAGLDPRRSAGDSQMIDTYDDAAESQNCIVIDGFGYYLNEQVS